MDDLTPILPSTAYFEIFYDNCPVVFYYLNPSRNQILEPNPLWIMRSGSQCHFPCGAWSQCRLLFKSRWQLRVQALSAPLWTNRG